jgi:hypothetical protein
MLTVIDMWMRVIFFAADDPASWPCFGFRHVHPFPMDEVALLVMWEMERDGGCWWRRDWLAGGYSSKKSYAIKKKGRDAASMNVCVAFQAHAIDGGMEAQLSPSIGAAVEAEACPLIARHRAGMKMVSAAPQEGRFGPLAHY